MVHTPRPPGLRWDSTLFVWSRPELHQSQRANRRGPQGGPRPAGKLSPVVWAGAGLGLWAHRKLQEEACTCSPFLSY